MKHITPFLLFAILSCSSVSTSFAQDVDTWLEFNHQSLHSQLLHLMVGAQVIHKHPGRLVDSRGDYATRQLETIDAGLRSANTHLFEIKQVTSKPEIRKNLDIIDRLMTDARSNLQAIRRELSNNNPQRNRIKQLGAQLYKNIVYVRAENTWIMDNQEIGRMGGPFVMDIVEYSILDAENGIIYSDVRVYFINQMDHYFNEAYLALQLNNNKLAAWSIRKSIAYLKLEAARPKGEIKKAIRNSTEELTRLADNVEENRIQEEAYLRTAFARADYALAVYYHKQTRDAWSRNEATGTGRAMLAGVMAIVQTSEWTGHRLDDDVTAFLEAIADAAGRLTEGGGKWTKKEIDQSIIEMEKGLKAVEKLANNVLPVDRVEW